MDDGTQKGFLVTMCFMALFCAVIAVVSISCLTHVSLEGIKARNELEAIKNIKKIEKETSEKK